VIHHGTLLFDSNLEILSLCLKPRYDNQNVIKSVMAKTTNIKSYLNLEAETSEFMEYLLSNVFVDDYRSHIMELSDDDKNRVEKLVLEKYGTDKWNLNK